MKAYICQICGDAYIGKGKPPDCPFCGAPENYIKEGNESNPVVEQKIEISEKSKENLKATLDLEIKAVAIYNCMASKTDKSDSKAMFKRLAKVEMEHASIVTKILKIDKPEVGEESCSEEEKENFKATIELEEHASGLYAQFAKEAEEPSLKMLFNALNQAELGHIELMKNYL